MNKDQSAAVDTDFVFGGKRSDYKQRHVHVDSKNQV